MHPLPPQEELEYLVGSKIGQITVDPFQVRFVFTHVDVLAEMAVSEPISYRDGDVEDVFAPDNGSHTQPPIRFHALLGQRLSNLTVSSEGDRLTLRFAKGQILTIRSTIGGPYESGTINGRHYWVF